MIPGVGRGDPEPTRNPRVSKFDEETPAMMSQGRRMRYVLALVVAPALLIVAACSDDGLGRRYSVSGTVKYKGAPVQKGTISFVPVEKEGRGASGRIEDGAYSLTTHTPGDGALPGKYKVVVDTREIDETALKAAADKFAKDKKIEGLKVVPQHLQAQFSEKAKPVTPLKYLTAQSSDMEVTVPDHSVTIDIDLKD
jgi:hypothetical protein